MQRVADSEWITLDGIIRLISDLLMVDTIKEVQRRKQVLVEGLTKSGDPELIILVAPLEQIVGQQSLGYLSLPANLVLVVLLVWYTCVEICMA